MCVCVCVCSDSVIDEEQYPLTHCCVCVDHEFIEVYSLFSSY